MRWSLPFTLCLSLSSICPLFAEDPVNIPDPLLKTAIENTLGVSSPTPTDMLALISLESINTGIQDLTGLEYATNLQQLYLRLHAISDLSPLSGLTSLE